MSHARILLSLFTSLLLVAVAGSAQATALYRINVGGPAVGSVDAGIAWAEDSSANPSTNIVGSGGASFYNTSSSSSHGLVTTGPAGVPLDIFQTERWDPPADPAMTWAFTVPAGSYEVRLYFAEIYNGITVDGDRLFDVSVEGAVPAAFTGIDPFALGGSAGSVGSVLSSTTTVSDGTLDLVFIHAVENPNVKGIEIIAVPEPTTALLVAGGLFALGRRARRARA